MLSGVILVIIAILAIRLIAINGSPVVLLVFIAIFVIRQLTRRRRNITGPEYVSGVRCSEPRCQLCGNCISTHR